MANYIVDGSYLDSIANAIREKTDSTAKIKLTDMSKKIKAIETGTDTSTDTVTPETLIEGYTAHNSSGSQITGVNPYELTSTNATVSEQEELIAQIEEALVGKAAGGGDGNETLDALIEGTLTKLSGNNEIIRTYAFYDYNSLTSINFPVCTSIGRSAFAYCYSLTSISFPACTYIGNHAFRSCTSLTSANFPACISIYYDAFCDCTSLQSANFPACTSIGDYAFYDCRSLTSASFPACKSIGYSAFQYCSSLTTANFPACTTIGSNAFSECYSLISLYLTGSSLCTLYNSNAFTSTPIDGYSASAGCYGSIYVPSALLSKYQSATNWTYFSNRFVGLDIDIGDNDTVPADVISFTIANVSYQAEEGMRWIEWIDSEYNVDNFYIDTTSQVRNESGNIVLGALVSSIITANRNYSYEPSAPPMPF